SEKGLISDRRRTTSREDTPLMETSFDARRYLCWLVVLRTYKSLSNNVSSSGKLSYSCPHNGKEVCPSLIFRVSLISSISISFSVLEGTLSLILTISSSKTFCGSV